jgi:hypothetical protein
MGRIMVQGQPWHKVSETYLNKHTDMAAALEPSY